MDNSIEIHHIQHSTESVGGTDRETAQSELMSQNDISQDHPPPPHTAF